MQQILKPYKKSIVLADDRERNSSIANFLEKMGLAVRFLRLNVGDYIISERVCVERKTSNDFVNSIINGRVFQQMQDIRRNYNKPVLIIEGSSFRETMNENALKAALSVLIVQYDASVLMTTDENDSAKTIYWLAKKEQEEDKRFVGIKGKKKPKETVELQEHVLSSLPGISTVLSKRLLKEFKSVKGVMNASESELAKVKGIGKNQAKKLYAIFNEGGK